MGSLVTSCVFVVGLCANNEFLALKENMCEQSSDANRSYAICPSIAWMGKIIRVSNYDERTAIYKADSNARLLVHGTVLAPDLNPLRKAVTRVVRYFLQLL